MRHNSSVLFQHKFYILSTKGAYQSTSLVKFHVSSRKSEILHFDQFLLSKSYNGLAKKIEKSYLSWHWRVDQSLKKNWLVVSNMTWGIWLIFTQPPKTLKKKIIYLFLFIYFFAPSYNSKKINKKWIKKIYYNVTILNFLQKKVK